MNRLRPYALAGALLLLAAVAAGRWRGLRAPGECSARSVASDAAREQPEAPPGADAFILSDANSEAMVGCDDRANERWLDIAANAYSSEFARNFSYTGPARIQPVVRVRYDRRGSSFQGRIEAHQLKPNFAYQMKLRGDARRDLDAFERIGYAGRWRFPGRATNYSDYDYLLYRGDRTQVESYILFDYFVTDAHGRAVKDFELDSTLHVLWNAEFQGIGTSSDPPGRRFVVRADDPATYLLPKLRPAVHFLWAQAEGAIGRAPVGEVRLPAGAYQAEFVLTEESFHSCGDGGYWATVLRLPVSFVIER